MRRLGLVAIALVCWLPLAQAVPSVATPERAPAAGAEPVASQPAARVAAGSSYYCWRSTKPTCRVTPGVTFNSATGTNEAKFRILKKIISTIRRTPAGETIRVMSWNIMSRSAVDALLDAQRRGIMVRVIMDAANQSSEVPNGHFARLRRGFIAYNPQVTPARRSYAMKCSYACRRGNGGSAHAKYYLFSRVGASRNVVIQGSANLTTASATNQWNDIFTYTDKLELYKFMVRVFGEMWQDQYASPSWVGYNQPTYGVYFNPRGNATADPLETTLNQVECRGAVNAGTANGRTIIRIAPDVWRGQWGMRVAKVVRRLWNEGCDVKVGYTILGADTRRYLLDSAGRGPVPLRHLVQDFDGDGDFDNYFHLKAWTINGRIGSDRTAHWMMNGSSNVSDLSQISDENIGFFRYRSVVVTYQNFIERWFNNPPRSKPLVPGRYRMKVDPYQNVDRD